MVKRVNPCFSIALTNNFAQSPTCSEVYPISSCALFVDSCLRISLSMILPLGGEYTLESNSKHSFMFK